ncbi:hypothetical protein K435DRAFT_867068 [Dendrothele bispora CBS 962.96]|uniref:G domain-containing protein n=1 Tax=Dendrothele bispora (strain CBS 962.96) TaxID=1314807 RepID=A0A4S8LFQ1_DENBC|nr:hypothetical protein K435DRAFT_867068 [Dendrothele bispora CBS 962.96]
MSDSSTKILDEILQDGKDTDIVIPVMGATGAGKSTFINYLFGDGKDHVQVGHHLTSCTVNVTPVILPSTSRNPQNPDSEPTRVIILDTPGFDDTLASDVEILRRIANWLATSYRKKMVLAGVIYLHDISQDRFTGTARRNLSMFNHLCGEASLDKVVLVSTKWERFRDAQIPTAREGELKDKHWKFMVGKGSQVERFRLHSLKDEPLEKTGKESARHIVNLVRQRQAQEKGKVIKKFAIQIQHELVDSKKFVPQTEAGKQLNYSLKEFIDMQKQLVTLEKGTAEAGDQDREDKIVEMERTIRRLEEQMRSLKVSLPQRLKQIFKKLELAQFYVSAWYYTALICV